MRLVKAGSYIRDLKISNKVLMVIGLIILGFVLVFLQYGRGLVLQDRIAAASVEQSSGIEQVNPAVMQMDKMTQQNAALAEQASAASGSMREQAQEMARHMAFFQLNR